MRSILTASKEMLIWAMRRRRGVDGQRKHEARGRAACERAAYDLFLRRSAIGVHCVVTACEWAKKRATRVEEKCVCVREREREGVCVCVCVRREGWEMGSDRIDGVRCSCDAVGKRIRNGRRATRWRSDAETCENGRFRAQSPRYPYNAT